MNRTIVFACLALAACNPSPATPDAATPNDAASTDAPDPIEDTGTSPDGGSDTGVDAASITTDAGASVSTETFCERLVTCSPGVTQEACVTGVDAELDRVEAFGCRDEGDAANACTYEDNEPDAEGMCHATVTRCDAAYTAYNHCVVEATGVGSFSCSLGYACNLVEGSAATPEAGCPSSFGTLVEECPTSGTVAGRCVRTVPGDVTYTTTYYEPLPDGVTPEILEETCVRPTSGSVGTWTAP